MAASLEQALRAASSAMAALVVGIAAFFAVGATVAWAHNHDAMNPWLASFLPQVAVGALLGARHRWIYLPVAAGMLLTVGWFLTTKPGPFAPYILAGGWPLALAGLFVAITRRAIRSEARG